MKNSTRQLMASLKRTAIADLADGQRTRADRGKTLRRVRTSRLGREWLRKIHLGET